MCTQTDIITALAAKMERYRNPWQELRLQYGQNKGKAYTGAPLLDLHKSLCQAHSCQLLPLAALVTAWLQHSSAHVQVAEHPLCEPGTGASCAALGQPC